MFFFLLSRVKTRFLLPMGSCVPQVYLGMCVCVCVCVCVCLGGGGVVSEDTHSYPPPAPEETTAFREIELDSFCLISP